jgi:ferrochelatase
VGSSAQTLDKLRHFFDHPGFIEPQRDSVAAAIGDLAPSRRPTTRLLFVAHSIPVTMAAQAGPNGGLYVEQLRAASALVAEAAPGIEWELVYSSRSGPPSVAWLEPDINDRIRELAIQGVTEVVAVPVGFVSDHIEVRWDLDVEAAATAREVGVTFRRTDPPSADPRFVGMVRELVVERLDAEAPVRALSSLGPSYDVCPTGCCRHPEPG